MLDEQNRGLSRINSYYLIKLVLFKPGYILGLLIIITDQEKVMQYEIGNNNNGLDNSIYISPPQGCALIFI